MFCCNRCELSQRLGIFDLVPLNTRVKALNMLMAVIIVITLRWIDR